MSRLTENEKSCTTITLSNLIKIKYSVTLLKYLVNSLCLIDCVRINKQNGLRFSRAKMNFDRDQDLR